MKCFVISPIGEPGTPIRRHADAVLEFIIEPAMQEFDIETVRSDRMVEAGTISDHMFREILEADLCVAILTGHNPNVFYELAVAQCAARPVITLVERGGKLPFDVQDLRCVEYEIDDICRLVHKKPYAKELKEHLQALAASGWIAKGLLEKHCYGSQQRFEQQLRQMLRQSRPDPLPLETDAVYGLPSDPGRQIVVLTGDIIKLRDHPVDVVVSMEDTNLQLARYFETSIPGAISGTLRYMDAKKGVDGSIVEDSTHERLRETIRRSRITLPAALGSVVVTPTAELKRLGISYIFHVVGMTGAVGDGYRMMDELVDDCVRNAFDRFARMARRSRLKSILFPMLGAVSTRLEPREVALRVLRPVVHKMKQIKACRRTYILAWFTAHKIGIRRAAAELGLEEVEPQQPRRARRLPWTWRRASRLAKAG